MCVQNFRNLSLKIKYFLFAYNLLKLKQLDLPTKEAYFYEIYTVLLCVLFQNRTVLFLYIKYCNLSTNN